MPRPTGPKLLRLARPKSAETGQPGAHGCRAVSQVADDAVVWEPSQRETAASHPAAMRVDPPMNPILIRGGVARAATAADRFGPGKVLDARTRAYLEAYFGRDLRFVRVHTGRAAGLAARLVGARAFASGRHLVFGAG